MTRRDTIIIAVFVNAAILIAFVITAVRNHCSESAQCTRASCEKTVEIPLTKNESKDAKFMEGQQIGTKAVECDEVDLILKQFAQNAPQIVQQEAVVTVAQPAVGAAVDFVQDIQTLMAPVRPPPIQKKSTEMSSSFQNPVVEITVRKGDALEKIARTHQTTVSEIMRLNNLKNVNLQIGQVLKIEPISDRKKSTGRENLAPKYYVVEKGDNPWTIAVKNHIKVEQLLRLNHMDEEKARHLKPGDKLRIQ